MKTHFRKIKSPNYLGSWDLMNDDGTFVKKVMTIKKASTKQITDQRGQTSDEAVLEFENYKPMILNHTNVRAIAKALKSPYIEDWIGKQITIYVKNVKAFGEYHDALRIEPIAPKVAKENTLSKERFNKALEALKTGQTTIDSIKKYKLTEAQLKNSTPK
jgi:FKBP-type peptidyl-prolyl cis-trans isomerase 2